MTPALAIAVLIIAALLLISGGRPMPLSTYEMSLLLMSECRRPTEAAAPPSAACCRAFSDVHYECGALCLCPFILDPSFLGFSSDTSGLLRIFHFCARSASAASLANYSSVLQSCFQGYEEMRIVSVITTKSVDPIWIYAVLSALILFFLGVRLLRVNLRGWFREGLRC